MSKQSNYAGIDYSLGNGSNVDKDTGIHYGMIAQGSLMAEALDEVFTNGKDLGYEQAKAELKDKLKAALSDYFSDHSWSDASKPTRLQAAVDNAFDALDGWADGIESNGPMHYEADGLTLQTTDRGELWVFKSQYFTHAQFCSPCVPGAGNLDTYCAEGPKTYCLGHDWFDGSKAPYPVYQVSDGVQVMPEA